MMPSYDDDRPTMEEEDLFKRLNNDLEQHQRIEALIQVIFNEKNNFDEYLEFCS